MIKFFCNSWTDIEFLIKLLRNDSIHFGSHFRQGSKATQKFWEILIRLSKIYMNRFFIIIFFCIWLNNHAENNHLIEESVNAVHKFTQYLYFVIPCVQLRYFLHYLFKFFAEFIYCNFVSLSKHCIVSIFQAEVVKLCR